MELNQLIYFKTVAETEHITQAAEKLNISQPALSRTILRLEDSVGTQLFTREKNRVTLNDAGRIFLRRVDRALQEIEDGVEEIHERDDISRKRIAFSVTESGFISAPLVSYMLKNPDIHMRQAIQTIDEIKASLESGEIDFAVVFRPIESEVLEWIPLVSEEILAFVGLGHPLSGKETISLNDLRNERFLFNNSSYNIKEIICDYCRRIGFEPDILYEGFENEVSDKLVENNMGILFVPSTAYYFHFREFPPPEILATPLHLTEAVGKRIMGISMRRSHYLSSAARHFFDFLLRYFNVPPRIDE